MHAFVMPNRGGTGDSTADRSSRRCYLDEEMQLMMERAEKYRDRLRGWKTYCAWGDVPNASGWFLDSDTGMAFLEQVKAVSATSTRRSRRSSPRTRASRSPASTSAPPRRATSARPRRRNPGVHFIVYHSGYDTGDEQKAVPRRRRGRLAAPHGRRLHQVRCARTSTTPRTSARRARSSATCPNVCAELGSVWRDTMNDPDQAAHLLGKLINHVGPEARSPGAPTASGTARRSRRSSRCAASSSPTKGKELYGLPYGLEGDVEDPTRKAPEPGAHDPQRHPRPQRREAVQRRPGREAPRRSAATQVNALREDEYTLTRADNHLMETRPFASNVSPGARTRREVWKSITEGPWSP